ncbi:MAG: hypothetical protein QOD27_1685 [Microbacteriaceae bacterium]|nr:hypothetical protein [Microbacteriaceae bacterium]
MTVWQDQPPQSRRQVRLNERRDVSPENQVDIVEPTPDQPAFEAFPSGGWDVDAQGARPVDAPSVATHPATEAIAAQQHRSRAAAAIASGRRSQLPPATPVQAAGEQDQQDDAEQTRPGQGRRQVPSYDGPSFGVSAVGASAVGSSAADSSVSDSSARDASTTDETRQFELPPVADVPQSFRVRDFSPESRRSAFSSTADTAASDRSEPAAPTTENGSIWQAVLDAPDQGQGVEPEASVAELAANESGSLGSLVHNDSAEVNPGEAGSSDRALTRRELRARRQAEESKGGLWSKLTEAASNPAATPIESPAASDFATSDSPVADSPTADSMDEFDALLGADFVTPPPPELVEPTPFAEWPLQQESSEPSAAEEVLVAEIVENAAVEPVIVVENAVVEQVAEIVENTMVEPALLVEPVPLVEPVRVIEQPSDAAAETASSVPTTFTVPTGHWSTQAAVEDDDVQLQANTLSRDVGVTSGAITTSHLVISSVPTATDLFRPFNATGEILITGSIDLPRSLGTTGAHPARYDHSDVDALLEAGDREDSNVDSAPVRAIRAISTHTSTRGVIETTTPTRNGRLPMILAISTAAVVVAGAGLVVAGMIFNVF